MCLRHLCRHSAQEYLCFEQGPGLQGPGPGNLGLESCPGVNISRGPSENDLKMVGFPHHVHLLEDI